MKSIPRWLLKVLQLLGFTLVIGLATFLAVQYIERPIVYMSWTTKQCVKVEVPPKHKQLTCEEAMRGSYGMEWVK